MAKYRSVYMGLEPLETILGEQPVENQTNAEGQEENKNATEEESKIGQRVDQFFGRTDPASPDEVEEMYSTEKVKPSKRIEDEADLSEV